MDKIVTARIAFERHIRSQWERSWRLLLDRNGAGAYKNFDIQFAWNIWQTAWRSRGRRG